MLAYAAKTDIGRVRKTNEDSFVILPPKFFIVADGMGGHAAGEIASSLGSKTVENFLSADDVAGVGVETTMPERLREAMEAANTAIWQEAIANPQYAGMGTTLTAVYLEESFVHWGHVGDSRLYLIREQQLQQLSNDHSLVGELLRSGALTPAEARVHPQRNMLLRAAGVSEQVTIDTGGLKWQQNDKLLLCTDGLTGMLTETEILNISTDTAATISERVDRLVDTANNAGGQDNITVILLEDSEAHE